MIRKRIFGATGATVSEIGFGTWGLGGTSYGPTDDRESIRALQLAAEKGVTFFDTSDLYGDGKSEAIVGEALRDVRSTVFIATKGGTLPHSGFYMPQNFSYDYLVQALSKSLDRLKTDYVDLYQLHSPILSELNLDEIHRFIEYGRSNKLFRSFGVSTRAPKDALEAIAKLPVDSIQANFNLIDHRVIECGLFSVLEQKNIAFIARTPLCFGYLTGKVNPDVVFEAGDHRNNWPVEQKQKWASAVELFRSHYQALGLSPIEYAISFCLAHARVATVIPGMLTCQHVHENTAVEDHTPLTAEDVATINRIYASNIFYDPTIKVAAINQEKRLQNE